MRTAVIVVLAVLASSGLAQEWWTTPEGIIDWNQLTNAVHQRRQVAIPRMANPPPGFGQFTNAPLVKSEMYGLLWENVIRLAEVYIDWSQTNRYSMFARPWEQYFKDKLAADLTPDAVYQYLDVRGPQYYASDLDCTRCRRTSDVISQEWRVRTGSAAERANYYGQWAPFLADNWSNTLAIAAYDGTNVGAAIDFDIVYTQYTEKVVFGIEDGQVTVPFVSLPVSPGTPFTNTITLVGIMTESRFGTAAAPLWTGVRSIELRPVSTHRLKPVVTHQIDGDWYGIYDRDMMPSLRIVNSRPITNAFSVGLRVIGEVQAFDQPTNAIVRRYTERPTSPYYSWVGLEWDFPMPTGVVAVVTQDITVVTNTWVDLSHQFVAVTDVKLLASDLDQYYSVVVAYTNLEQYGNQPESPIIKGYQVRELARLIEMMTHTQQGNGWDRGTGLGWVDNPANMGRPDELVLTGSRYWYIDAVTGDFKEGLIENRRYDPPFTWTARDGGVDLGSVIYYGEKAACERYMYCRSERGYEAEYTMLVGNTDIRTSEDYRGGGVYAGNGDFCIRQVEDDLPYACTNGFIDTCMVYRQLRRYPPLATPVGADPYPERYLQQIGVYTKSASTNYVYSGRVGTAVEPADAYSPLLPVPVHDFMYYFVEFGPYPYGGISRDDCQPHGFVPGGTWGNIYYRTWPWPTEVEVRKGLCFAWYGYNLMLAIEKWKFSVPPTP